MMEEFCRTERLLGAATVEKLSQIRVAVFGIGGVGGHAAEALVRSGIGALDIVDGDEVALSNINRQIIALHSTVGMPKTEAAAERFLDINPNLRLKKFQLRLSEETAGEFDFSAYDYVIDAIDDVRAKVLLAVKCKESGTPLISSMGAGNKVDPTKFQVADIYKTSVCPLARVMRRELKQRGIEHLKVVFSTELPAAPTKEGERVVPASCAFVPSVAGLIIASEVVKDIVNADN
ncbi:MAG: tRNA threonylcarbamoyladenosine dehydratase [Oscillospiraceae bacterium]|nr:tRNA threonylcarbamoyladenosine dehydratase [Oscillospiraceae bacterium]